MRTEVGNGPDEKLAPPRSSWESRGWFGISYQEFAWILLISDFSLIVVLSLASGMAYHASAFGTSGDIGTYIGAGFVVGGLFVACQKALGLYDPIVFIGRGKRLSQVIAVWVLVFTFFATAAFLLKVTDGLSRGTMLIWFGSGIVLVISVHEAAGRLLAQGLVNGSLRARPVLVVCDQEEVSDSELGRLLRQTGYEVRQFFVAPAGTVDQPGEKADVLDDVRAYVRSQDVDEILVCMSWNNKPRLDALVSGLRVVPLPVRLIPDRQIRPLIAESILRTGPALGVEVQRAPLTRTEQAAKRAFDFAFSAFGLAMLIPLFTIVAVAVKMDSAGPVLFRQSRTGFNGRKFSIYKFRTMTTMDNGAVVRQATRNDARVTRVGRWLRSTSIDELPQLLNVLAGHMSLVGPRPHALAHDDHYSRLIADYAMRQHVKPGITGWAQVNGFRGETSEIDQMRCRVEHDLWYISNWSFLLDIRIIARTCIQVLNPTNVY
jgi:Undecaprenyl-phosphate glucose phosphotransferase